MREPETARDDRADEDEPRPRLTLGEGVGLAVVMACAIALACVFSLVRDSEHPAPTSVRAVARAGK